MVLPYSGAPWPLLCYLKSDTEDQELMTRSTIQSPIGYISYISTHPIDYIQSRSKAGGGWGGGGGGGGPKSAQHN